MSADKIEEVKIDTWDQFRAELAKQRIVEPVYWRGQSDSSWVLASSFEREMLHWSGGSIRGASMRYPYDGRFIRGGKSIFSDRFFASMRDRYLEAFKEHSSGLRGPNPATLNDDEWWALGRHYGLITPLLEWTHHPYIAAFFALSDSMRNPNVCSVGSNGKSVAVFQLMHGKGLEGNGLRVLKPRVEELGRLQGQRGLFTRLDSTEFFELEGFLESHGRGSLLTKYVLSMNVIDDAFTEFRRAGIDSRLIYPDLQGAALAANDRFIPSIEGFRL